VPRYVGLLRGVNVGGNNLVPMPQLRSVVTSLGHSDVSTYIQSGNIVFTSKEEVTPQSLETAIESAFGIRIDVILRTPAELKRALKANPFETSELATVHVGFMKAPPPAGVVAKLDPEPFLPERFVIKASELYVCLPNGVARTKLLSYLARHLEVPTTLRSWKTVTKLVDLAG
jgi:uncharacterized protein (DUF1697 family)